MATIKKGIYRWNHELTIPNFSQTVLETVSLPFSIVPIEVMYGTQPFMITTLPSFTNIRVDSNTTDYVYLDYYVGPFNHESLDHWSEFDIMAYPPSGSLDQAEVYATFSSMTPNDGGIWSPRFGSTTFPNIDASGFGQTIEVLQDTSVDDTFGTWFFANTERVEENVITAGTYRFNETLTAIPTTIQLPYEFYFSNGGEGYTDIYLADNVLQWRAGDGSFVNNVYNYETQTWEYDSERVIIVDTPQTVSKDFYTWFTENIPSAVTKKFTLLYLGDVAYSSGGKCFKRLSTEEPKNLTGTTWHIPSGWNAKAMYGEFVITGTYTAEAWGTLTLAEDGRPSFLIGYAGRGALAADTLSIYYVKDTGSVANTAFNLGAFTLHITGGTDVTNPKLIEWLETYGVLQ